MTTLNQPQETEEITEQGVIERATKDFIKEKYSKGKKPMSEEMAALWARAIAAEEQERRAGWSKAEMSTKLRSHIEAALREAEPMLEEADRKAIREGYKKSLEDNDYLSALSFSGVAEEEGIDLTDIEKTVKTNLDLDAIKRGDAPPFAA